MSNAIIPKFLFEDEDIIYLRDKGIKLDEGVQHIGKQIVPCYRFFNMDEMEVFDELRNPMNEDTESEKNSYGQRVVSLLFLRIRQVMQMKDIDQKVNASLSLISAVNSLALINVQYARRFISLLRSIC